jgi:Secretion system C-terminal sorting domain
MKKNLTLMPILMMAFVLRAQLPAGSLAPNFNVTDINGNTHNLYAILDSGKSVIMDISATWCGPCWSFHQAGTLKNIHNQFGAAGTNEVRVLFVEGDGATTLDNLNGIAGPRITQGNWVAGTPYPIIDTALISSLYRIAYYPTLYVICPDRRLVEVPNKTQANIMAAARSCPPAARGTNNAMIREYTGYNDLFCNNKTFQPVISIENMGLDTARSVSVTLKKDGALVQTKTLTTPLGKYDIQPLTFDNVSLNNTGVLTFDIATVNGVTDTAAYKNTLNQTITRGAVLQYDTVTVEIRTDVDVKEIYWFIKDPSGTKVAQGGNPNVMPGRQNANISNAGTYTTTFTVYTHQVRLPSNVCYEYVSQDEWGDGFTNIYNATRTAIIGTFGYFKVWKGTTIGAGGVLLYNGGDGVAFSEIKRPIERSFRVGTAELTEVGKISVFPNPSDAVLNLNFDLDTNMPLAIEVTNPLGQTVYQVAGQKYAAGTHQLEIPTASLGNGMYFVTIKNEKAQIMRKFTVQH